MPNRIALVCQCGHIDDEHQSLTGQVLAEGQKLCYRHACECGTWTPVLRTRTVNVFEVREHSLHEAVEQLVEKGRWYEWVE